MASIFKKSQAQAESDAAVSSIPVPPADSALVIDLPEGQKLVLGKMEEGTVIEVATWRGTGRPDSRTNRLMLGVSFGGTSESQSPEVTDQKLSKVAEIQSKLGNLISDLVNKIKNSVAVFKLKYQSTKSKRNSTKDREIFPSIESGASKIDAEEDFDIDEWLQSVRSKSRLNRLADETNHPSSHRGKKKKATPTKSRAGKSTTKKGKIRK